MCCCFFFKKKEIKDRKEKRLDWDKVERTCAMHETRATWVIADVFEDGLVCGSTILEDTGV